MQFNLCIISFYFKRNILFFITFISLLLKELSQDISDLKKSIYPITLTLSNNNILLITNTSILFYNSYFNSTIKSTYLSEEEKAKTKEETFKTLICECPGEYVMILVKDQLKICTLNGDIIGRKNLTEEHMNFPLYNLIPIKVESDYLYYIMAYTNGTDYSLRFFYYKIKKDGNEFTKIVNKEYKLSNFLGDNENAVTISNIVCELMKNDTDKEILVCFYGREHPIKLHMTSFDINNNLTQINNIYIGNSVYIKYVKAKCNGNKNQALICYSSFTNDALVYCSIYDLHSNTLSEPKVCVSKAGSSFCDLELYYFKNQEQFILISKDNSNILHIAIFDINFVNNGEITYKFGDGFYQSNRESIIYLPQYEKYSIISDSLHNGAFSITNFIINNTTEVKITSLTNNNNDNTLSTEEYLISDSTDNNVLSTEEYLISDSTNSKALNTEEYIITDSTDNIILGNKRGEISNITKCLYSDKKSIQMNLCIECNKTAGYYPLSYYNKLITDEYIECINDSTKPINFFFNEEREQYEPCYETCRTCNFSGNAKINNCTSCDFNSIFRPEKENTTNCIKECRYRYYITPYGQYKCSKDNECNSIASLYIKEKNKCTNNCSLDDTYFYQYNGECLDSCPKGTEPENNICVAINKEKCSIDLNEYSLEDTLTTDNIDLLAKTYAKEYIYTKNHISLFKHEFYLITLYKNKECITNLGLSIPQIDFGNCYNIIQDKNHIYEDLLILIIEKYYNGKSVILYSFYNPENGDKLDTTNLCNQEKIMIEENIIATLNSTDINIDNLLKLTEQNINLFNTSSEFYNDICFHFESPNGKDITLGDRILEFYPNITLCNEGCFIEGLNLTTLTALCQCTFTEILSGSIFSDNIFISKISEEIIEIISLSNLEILKCYKDIFVYKYFKKNIGEFIILGVIFLQTFCVTIFIFVSMNNMRKYTFGLIEIYLKYINPQYSMKYSEYIPVVIKDNPPIKEKKLSMRRRNKFLTVKKIDAKNMNNEKENEENESKYVSIYSRLPFTKSKEKNGIGTTRILTNKGKATVRYSNNYNKITRYMKEYLSTSGDDMDYDDAIKRDKRRFFNFFWERVKVNTWVVNIIFSEEKLKPRSIKFLLFLLNIDLYFVINGLYFNEGYISEVYHNNEEEKFFDFVSRTNYNFFYASMTGALIEYLIKCFFVEEKKFKGLFRREKDNELHLRSEFSNILSLIKSRYISFFITSYIITIFSWYYVTCFNNVYPNIKLEWIKSSIFIIIIMIFVYMGLALLETILRFLSFKCKSEKLFKFSKIFANCC